MVDLEQYLPILIFLFIAVGLSALFVFLPMGVSRLTGAHKPNAEKNSEYECGFPAFEDSRSQFDVKFYLVAIIFLLFDLAVDGRGFRTRPIHQHRVFRQRPASVTAVRR